MLLAGWAANELLSTFTRNGAKCGEGQQHLGQNIQWCTAKSRHEPHMHDLDDMDKTKLRRLAMNKKNTKNTKTKPNQKKQEQK